MPHKVEVVGLLFARESVQLHVLVHRLVVVVLRGVELVAHLPHDAVDPPLARVRGAVRTPLAAQQQADAGGAAEEERSHDELELERLRGGRAAALEDVRVVGVVVNDTVVGRGNGHGGRAVLHESLVRVVVGRDGTAYMVVSLEDRRHPVLLRRGHVEGVRREVAVDAREHWRRREVVAEQVDHR